DRALARRFRVLAGFAPVAARHGTTHAPPQGIVQFRAHTAVRLAGGGRRNAALLRALVRLARRLVLRPALPVRNDAGPLSVFPRRLQRFAFGLATAGGGRISRGVCRHPSRGHVRLQRPPWLEPPPRIARSRPLPVQLPRHPDRSTRASRDRQGSPLTFVTDENGGFAKREELIFLPNNTGFSHSAGRAVSPPPPARRQSVHRADSSPKRPACRRASAPKSFRRAP